MLKLFNYPPALISTNVPAITLYVCMNESHQQKTSQKNDYKIKHDRNVFRPLQYFILGL